MSGTTASATNYSTTTRTTARTSNTPDTSASNIGFRCAYDFPPS